MWLIRGGAITRPSRSTRTRPKAGGARASSRWVTHLGRSWPKRRNAAWNSRSRWTYATGDLKTINLTRPWPFNRLFPLRQPRLTRMRCRSCGCCRSAMGTGTSCSIRPGRYANRGGSFSSCSAKTAYEIFLRDWSSDVCSSDLQREKSIERPRSCQVNCFQITSSVSPA